MRTEKSSAPRQRSPLPTADREDPRPSTSLETVIALVLCVVVALGSVALIETDRRITGALREMPAGIDVPARALVRTGRSTPPSLVCVVSLAGLRADRLGPAEALRELSSESIRFRTVAAQASHGLVSLKSVFTGKYPASLLLEERNADLAVLAKLEEPRAFLQEAFASVPTTLPALLRDAGYETAAFTDGGWASRDNGFERGFDAFHEETVTFAGLVDRANLWIENQDTAAFVYLHTRELLDTDNGTSAAAYDHTLARLDRALARLVARLRAGPHWNETLLVVTGDHGQSLGERGDARSGDLYLEQLLVPLVLRLPPSTGQIARDVDEAVELVDLLPSLVSFCGGDVPQGIDGTSFLPVLFRGVRGKEFLVGQTAWDEGGASPARRCVLDPGKWQVIHDAESDEVEFFALDVDPAGLSPTPPSVEDVPPFLRVLLREASVTPAVE